MSQNLTIKEIKLGEISDNLKTIELHLRDISKSLQVMSGRTKEQMSDKPKTGYAASYFARSKDDE